MYPWICVCCCILLYWLHIAYKILTSKDVSCFRWNMLGSTFMVYSLPYLALGGWCKKIFCFWSIIFLQIQETTSWFASVCKKFKCQRCLPVTWWAPTCFVHFSKVSNSRSCGITKIHSWCSALTHRLIKEVQTSTCREIRRDITWEIQVCRMFEIRWWPPHARRSIGGERSCELAAHPPAPLPLARGAAESFVLLPTKHKKWKISVRSPCQAGVPRQAARSVSALRKPNPYFDPSKLPPSSHIASCWNHEWLRFSDTVFGCG